MDMADLPIAARFWLDRFDQLKLRLLGHSLIHLGLELLRVSLISLWFVVN